MNLTIHWLEQELCNYYDTQNKFTLNLDFNHNPVNYAKKKDIPVNEMSYFSTDEYFGELHLHYIFIGRHFLEMYEAQDFECLKDQFRPQTVYNATCGLVFSEPKTLKSPMSFDMHDYYLRRGGQPYFGYSYDDTRLAKGFFNLGQLENLAEFDTVEKRQSLRNLLKTNPIIKWEKVA
jgi:hypothetical protein